MDKDIEKIKELIYDKLYENGFILKHNTPDYEYYIKGDKKYCIEITEVE